MLQKLLELVVSEEYVGFDALVLKKLPNYVGVWSPMFQKIYLYLTPPPPATKKKKKGQRKSENKGKILQKVVLCKYALGRNWSIKNIWDLVRINNGNMTWI